MQYLLFALLTLLARQCSEPPPYSSPEDNGFAQDTIVINNVQDTVIEVDTMPKTLAHILIARRYEGVPPVDTINMFLASVDLPPGNPWCSAFLSFVLDEAEVLMPSVRSGLARNFVYQSPQKSIIPAGRVLAGVADVPEGSIVVFQRGNTKFGHNGINTELWSGASGVYISGNTSPPSGGSEAAGGGVWEKTSRINPNAVLQIREFVIVEY
jgi:hypothetical protein